MRKNPNLMVQIINQLQGENSRLEWQIIKQLPWGQKALKSRCESLYVVYSQSRVYSRTRQFSWIPLLYFSGTDLGIGVIMYNRVRGTLGNAGKEHISLGLTSPTNWNPGCAGGVVQLLVSTGWWDYSHLFHPDEVMLLTELKWEIRSCGRTITT